MKKLEFSHPYATKIESFALSGLLLQLEQLKDLDSTIDEFFLEYERTGREELFEDLCPYFGVPWPAGKKLAELVAKEGNAWKQERILELGCGLALPSLVLAKLGIPVTVTDLHPDVPVFLERNCKLNSISNLDFTKIDWREPSSSGQKWDRILASDVLYDKKLLEPLVRFLEHNLTQGGEFLVLDPGRPYWESFAEKLKVQGWQIELQKLDSIFLLRGRH